MDYPLILLPSSEKKLIEQTISENYLIRFFEEFEGVPITIEEKGGKLHHIYIFGERNESTRRITDLSTILFGIFRSEHIKLQLTPEGVNEYKDYCEPDCIVKPPVFNEHFKIDEGIKYWAIKINDIAGKTIEYKNPTTNQVLKATCRVMHTPKKSNFWHYSIDWETEDGLFRDLKPILKNFDRKVAKKFGPGALLLFTKHATINEPSTETIPDELYLKKSTI